MMLHDVEEASVLDDIMADARATQDIHREIIGRISTWEVREPGRIATDDELRNAFIQNLEGLRTAFTDRTLSRVGVIFPMLLDRANPAHAIILAVRDDLADTRDRLEQKQTQYVLAKEIQEIKQGQIAKMAEEASLYLRSLPEKLEKPLGAAADAAKYLAYGAGALALVYLLNTLFGGRRK